LAALGALRVVPVCCGDDHVIIYVIYFYKAYEYTFFPPFFLLPLQDIGGPQEAFAKWLPSICAAVGMPQQIEVFIVQSLL
jgi:hypothetical protein